MFKTVPCLMHAGIRAGSKSLLRCSLRHANWNVIFACWRLC